MIIIGDNNLGKIYTDVLEFEKAMEADFQEKCKMVAMYQGDQERMTLDHEWSESELKDDLYSEALRVLNGDKEKGTKGWLEQHKHRAFKDEQLTHVEFIVEDICSRFDIVEVYNRAYDLHRNDENRMFGIHYFDELTRAEVLKVLKNNLLT